MTICYFGDFDPAYSRNRVVISGLEQNGVRVLLCNTRTKGLKKYWNLMRSHRSLKGSYDFLMVGCSDSRWVIVLARLLTRKPIIWNPLYSLYDSWVLDRQLVPKHSPKAFYYFFLDWLCCLLADGILLDTNENIKFFQKKFGVSNGKFKRIFVGTDETVFYPRISPRDSFVVHFHGYYIPFHGIEYILKAADILYKENIKFNIIGAGQTYKKIRALGRELHLDKVQFIDRVSYQTLADYIGQASLCLGVFGDGDRVDRVIPNKIFEALASKRAVITAHSVAVEELLKDGESVIFCRQADPSDLAHKILELKNNTQQRENIAKQGFLVYNSLASTKTIGLELFDFLKAYESKKLL